MTLFNRLTIAHFMLVFVCLTISASKSKAQTNQDNVDDDYSYDSKIIRLRKTLDQFNICYARFLKCSARLNAAFCASPQMKLTFFSWAKQLASKILHAPGAECSDAMMRLFLKNTLQHSKQGLNNNNSSK